MSSLTDFVKVSEKIEIVKVNVGGQLFITKESTIKNYPGTKLSNSHETCDYVDKSKNEYYFDRNPLIFHSILDYYRTGKLHFGTNVCADNIREALEFWEIPTSELEPCCWKHFCKVNSDLKTVDIIEEHFLKPRNGSPDWASSTSSRLTNKLWDILEHPNTSKLAMIWQLFYLGVVCLAIGAVVCQSFEMSRPQVVRLPNNYTIHVKERLMDKNDWVLVINHICNVIFGFETSLRFLTCPDKCKFMKSFLNIVDMISAAGYLVLVIEREIPDNAGNYESVFVFTYILTVLCGFRFYRIERLFESLRLLMLSIKQSKTMLLLLVLILFITSIIFGIMVHIIEMDEEFSDPISSFYWAIITMTTTGYGDIYPKSYKGKIIASACATVGLFLLSMPMAIVASTFRNLNTRYIERCNHLKHQLRATRRSKKNIRK